MKLKHRHKNRMEKQIQYRCNTYLENVDCKVVENNNLLFTVEQLKKLVNDISKLTASCIIEN